MTKDELLDILEFNENQTLEFKISAEVKFVGPNVSAFLNSLRRIYSLRY